MSGGFSALNYQHEPQKSGRVFIDFLQPSVNASGAPNTFSSVYYYQLLGSAGCTGLGYYNGTVTMQPEVDYLYSSGFSIYGTVYNASTGQPVGAGIGVIARCLGSYYDGWSQETTTNSYGFYTVSAYEAGTGWPDYACFELWTLANLAASAIVVSVYNGYDGFATSSNVWNASDVIWAPQSVNFYLAPANLSTTPTVTTAEFTHTGFAQVSYCKGSSSTVEMEADSSLSGTLFGISYGVSSSTEFTDSLGSSSCANGQGYPGFEDWGYHHTAGDIVFDAIAGRTTWIPWIQYYGPTYHGTTGNATGAPLQDWMAEPGSSGACDIAGTVWSHEKVNANSAPLTETVSASGSVSGVSGESVGVSAPVVIDDVTIGSVAYSTSYSLTTSESNDFTVAVLIPTSSVAHYFTIACTGSSASDSGIVVHVWLDSGP